MTENKLNPQKIGEIIQNLPIIHIKLLKKNLAKYHEL